MTCLVIPGRPRDGQDRVTLKRHSGATRGTVLTLKRHSGAPRIAANPKFRTDSVLAIWIPGPACGRPGMTSFVQHTPLIPAKAGIQQPGDDKL